VDVVAAVRRFNRAHVRRIDALAESYLGVGRPLGEARVLYELGAGTRPVGELRAALGLDSGYLSRLLRGLEAEGVVAVAPDPNDGRRRVASLTPRGEREFARLDQRSERAAAALVAGLDEPRRRELVLALDRVDRLFGLGTLSVADVDVGSADARAALDRYLDELGQRFVGGVDLGAVGADGDQRSLRPPGGAFVVLRTEAGVVGCGGLRRLDSGDAEIKRMWIDPAWRGLGLGARLLAELERRARTLGHDRVVLDTNESLTEAINLYRRHGYEPIDRYSDNPYAHHWFAKQLG
jgi:DNA-binding MarR family transcriptional regulator/predicted GNAT family N-acyltransferase